MSNKQTPAPVHGPSPRLDGVQQHTGGCLCGAVRYQVEVDLSKGGTRCNCSICTKLGSFGTVVKPAAFKLLAGESARLVVPNSVGDRTFCKQCGTFCYGAGNLPEMGGEFVSVNLNTIDGIDPYALPVMYWDGRHDNWQVGPRPTPWPVHAAQS